MLSCFKGNYKKCTKTAKTTTDSYGINTKDPKIASKRKTIFIENEMDDLYYNVSDGRDRKVFIFNQETFDEGRKLEDRIGTNVDCDRLVECFCALGFMINRFDDLTAKEIKREVERASKMKSADVNCIIVIVMTYGRNNVLHAKDTIYNMNDVLMPFVESESLAGVPKLFFIQMTDVSKEETDGRKTVAVIPKFADILWTYSTVKDRKLSEKEREERNCKDGLNIFIQALCDHLNEDICRDYNILQIMALVNRRLISTVAEDKKINTDESKTIKSDTENIEINAESTKILRTDKEDTETTTTYNNDTDTDTEETELLLTYTEKTNTTTYIKGTKITTTYTNSITNTEDIKTDTKNNTEDIKADTKNNIEDRKTTSTDHLKHEKISLPQCKSTLTKMLKLNFLHGTIKVLGENDSSIPYIDDD